MFDLFGKSKTKPRQFKWRETQTGIRFTAPLDSLSVTEYAENLTANAYHAQAQWVLLKEMLDNGQAEFSDSEIFMPCEEVCRLDFVEQSLLGLPEPYPFDVEIRSDRTLKETEVSLQLSVSTTGSKTLASTTDRLRVAFDSRVGISPDSRTILTIRGIRCLQ